VAGWLVDQGARHVVLTSRRAPSVDREREAIERLQSGGAKIHVIPADVSSREDVERLLATVESTLPPLRGVVHMAGVVDDAFVRDQDWRRFERVMRPKVLGGWHLHRLTKDLDFFVMFSSGVGLLGSPGQANYAAANAFLDALAAYRQGSGQPALSIAWGPWEVGMTSRMEQRSRDRVWRIGLRPIRVHQGLGILAGLLSQPRFLVAAVDVDWDRVAAAIPASPLWADLAEAARDDSRRPSTVVAKLRETPAGGRMGMLVDHVRGELAAVLGWNSPEKIRPREKLLELGIDSLTAVELQRRLERTLGCSLPLTLAFDYPTVEALARYLADELELEAAEPLSAPREPDDLRKQAERVAAMSDEETQALLAQKLKDLL
jgi:myxalamid-type polyketide synthase MxaB